MTPKGNKTGKKVFRPILGLVSWWKGRRYYFATHDFASDEKSTTSGNNRSGHASSQLCIDRQPDQQKIQLTVSRAFTVDSLQDSSESMHSVINSYLDPGDETSQKTTPASNTGYKADFMNEHLGFLGSQTQPREVEIVLQM